MPNKPSRARGWIKEGKAIKKWSKLGVFSLDYKPFHFSNAHGVRKGDFVRAGKAGRIYYGWVSGDTEKQISVSAHNWKRLGQFTARKVELLQPSTGLICQFLYGGAVFLPSLLREEGLSCREIR